MKEPMGDHLADAGRQRAMLEKIEQRDELQKRMEDELAEIDARFTKAKAAAPSCIQAQLDEFHWRVRADYRAMMARDLGVLDNILASWMSTLGMTD